ncbi:hypothetical protein BN1110_05435 [bacterium YEK0313]|nr:hypothetical protein BN1110_05435 [bacterium YEK0313]
MPVAGMVMPGMIVPAVTMETMIMRTVTVCPLVQAGGRACPLAGRRRRLLRGLNVIMHDADTAVSGIPVTLSQE